MAALNFEEALQVEVKALTGLTTKVFPINAPEGTIAPYVTFDMNDRTLDETLGGYLDSGEQYVEVDVFETTAPLCRTLAAAVKAEIATWQGTTMATTGPAIQRILFDDSQAEVFLSDVNLYSKTISFRVYY